MSFSKTLFNNSNLHECTLDISWLQLETKATQTANHLISIEAQEISDQLLQAVSGKGVNHDPAQVITNVILWDESNKIKKGTRIQSHIDRNQNRITSKRF